MKRRKHSTRSSKNYLSLSSTSDRNGGTGKEDSLVWLSFKMKNIPYMKLGTRPEIIWKAPIKALSDQEQSTRRFILKEGPIQLRTFSKPSDHFFSTISFDTSRGIRPSGGSKRNLESTGMILRSCLESRSSGQEW